MMRLPFREEVVMKHDAYRVIESASFSGNPIEPEMNPGAQPPSDSPGAGEIICPKCTGSGLRDDGMPCDHCGGTGRVISDAHGV